MKIFLTILISLLILNTVVFAVNKLFKICWPYLFKLFFKKDYILSPELEETSAIREKYQHWFLSAWTTVFFAIAPLTSINFYLAMIGGTALYFIGLSESDALTNVLIKHNKEMEERFQIIFLEKFLKQGQFEAVETKGKK